jgi:hypothetical protein
MSDADVQDHVADHDRRCSAGHPLDPVRDLERQRVKSRRRSTARPPTGTSGGHHDDQRRGELLGSSAKSARGRALPAR